MLQVRVYGIGFGRLRRIDYTVHPRQLDFPLFKSVAGVLGQLETIQLSSKKGQKGLYEHNVIRTTGEPRQSYSGRISETVSRIFVTVNDGEILQIS